MKIGLVTPYVYPLPGGVNQHVQYLYEHLLKRGHDVRIISSTHGFQRSTEGDVIRLGRGFSMPANGSVGTLTLSPRYVSQVSEMLDREQFELLHFHEPFVPFLSLVLLHRSQSVNVATFHAYAGWSPAYEFGKRMLRGYADRLHGRIAVSAAARHFIDRYFPGDYKVIPNGVDLRRFEGIEPFRRYQDGTPNLLFVGRLEERKGLMHLLKAFRILRREGVDCRLLVVGSGPQEREARRYMATRGLRGVELLGRVSDEDKLRYYATADVYVSPATGRESFGIVLLEAMAAGTAIVCSDIHGYKGVVRRGEQALLVPPRDPEALADAIRELLGDPERRAAMGAAGRERARQFGWDAITAKVDDYYGFVIRRLAAQGQLPAGFRSEVPPDPRLAGRSASDDVPLVTTAG
ncbi:MAG TPA: glycosyltransferase family 4 protein [Candidatus Limnocylindrales bacterium]|nr:glycosyltransferase family 4 protein [Candidatus Limnocylindrales bacterium]